MKKSLKINGRYLVDYGSENRGDEKKYSPDGGKYDTQCNNGGKPVGNLEFFYGKRGYGTLLKKGMCIAIEPMITLGSRQIVMERDGWTVRTRDRKCAAHFEHTVAIGVGKADILSSFEYVEQVLGDKAI